MTNFSNDAYRIACEIVTKTDNAIMGHIKSEVFKCDGGLYRHVYSMNMNKIVKAIKKQIPKKPNYSIVGRTKYWTCPECNEVVLSHIDSFPIENEYTHDYCGGCGQAIDWSE